MPTQLHLAIDAFTLELLLERPQRLVDIVVANDDLHKKVSTFPKEIRLLKPGSPPLARPKRIGLAAGGTGVAAGPIAKQG
jgi:hypothetical protein